MEAAAGSPSEEELVSPVPPPHKPTRNEIPKRAPEQVPAWELWDQMRMRAGGLPRFIGPLTSAVRKAMAAERPPYNQIPVYNTPKVKASSTSTRPPGKSFKC